MRLLPNRKVTAGTAIIATAYSVATLTTITEGVEGSTTTATASTAPKAGSSGHNTKIILRAGAAAATATKRRNNSNFERTDIASENSNKNHRMAAVASAIDSDQTKTIPRKENYQPVPPKNYNRIKDGGDQSSLFPPDLTTESSSSSMVKEKDTTYAAAAGVLAEEDNDSSTKRDNSGNDDENMKVLKRQLNLLLVVRCLRSSHLAQPLLVPYYSQSLGLTPPSVLWLGSFYSALVTLAELPSGFLSDYLGRRTTLHIAFLGFGTSLLLTAFASSVSSSTTTIALWGMLGLAQFLRAIGSSMYSGTDMAFLYEIIKKYGGGGKEGGKKGNKRTTGNSVVDSLLLKIESRNVFYTTATEAVVAAIGGRIAKHVGLPMIVAISSVPFLSGAIISLFLDDVSAKQQNDKEQQRRKSYSTSSIENNDKININNCSDDDCGNRKSDDNNNRRKSMMIFARRTSIGTLPYVAYRRSSRFFSSAFSSTSPSSSFPPISPSSSIDDKDGGDEGDSSKTAIAAAAGTQSNTIIAQHSNVVVVALQYASNVIQKVSSQLREYVPQKLWTLFLVGVVLNCATYVASTALNPLLWELIGIPLEQFGTIHAGCGAISAVGALLAPTIRKFLSSSSSSSNNNKNTITTKIFRRSSNNDTEGLLLFMLFASAIAYVLMSVSTICHIHFVATSSSSMSDNSSSSSIGTAIIACFLLSLVRGLAWPILGSAINSSVESNGSRATTLSIFSGSVKIGMVLTGMVLGVIFNTSNNNGDLGDATGSSAAMIGKGLLQGCGLCGIVLVGTAGWLASIGLPSKSSTSIAADVSKSSSSSSATSQPSCTNNRSTTESSSPSSPTITKPLLRSSSPSPLLQKEKNIGERNNGILQQQHHQQQLPSQRKAKAE